MKRYKMDPSKIFFKALPGDDVKIGDITALVDVVQVSYGDYGPKTRYSIVWWTAGERREAWVDGYEFEPSVSIADTVKFLKDAADRPGYPKSPGPYPDPPVE